jgi:2-isopropylmalate synthase
VYSGVPAALVGREQEVDVGPMSGRSNVIFWLEKRGLSANDELVDRILDEAKKSDAVLGEERIRALLRTPS